MNKRTILLGVTALFLMMGLSQSVIAQNKVKKVKYLGHKYNGEVNQEKIPEGTGTMDYELFTVEGNFDGNNISNPVFKNTQLHFDYIGNASYDESNSIVLKAGGKMVNYCIVKDEFMNTYKERQISSYKLIKDSVISTKSMNTKELLISCEVQINLPQEINPPKIIISDVLPLTEYTSKEQTQGYSHEYKAKGFIGNDFLEKCNKIQGYKDDKGRIWDLENTSVSSTLKGWDVNVIYPDGSFYKGHIGSGESHEYSDNLKIVYSNGDIIECQKENERLSLCLNNGLVLYIIESMTIEDFAKLYSTKTYPKFKIQTIRDSKGLLKGLSSPEVGKVLEENVFKKFTDITERVYIRDDSNKYIGFYTEGKYSTEEEYIATIQAKEDKKKVEDEKALKAERDKFKSKYGFDPVIDKIGLKVGRTAKALDAWSAWLKDNGYYSYSFKLSQDRGSSKCYHFYYRGERAGFIWMKNDVITSVNWNLKY